MNPTERSPEAEATAAAKGARQPPERCFTLPTILIINSPDREVILAFHRNPAITIKITIKLLGSHLISLCLPNCNAEEECTKPT